MMTETIHRAVIKAKEMSTKKKESQKLKKNNKKQVKVVHDSNV